MLHGMPTLAGLSDTHRPPMRPAREVAVRPAGAPDRSAIDDLAALDSARSPRGTVLIAEVEGELWAAMSIEDGHVVADPFRPSSDAVALLRSRAAHVNGARRRRGLAALRPRLAA